MDDFTLMCGGLENSGAAVVRTGTGAGADPFGQLDESSPAMAGVAADDVDSTAAWPGDGDATSNLDAQGASV